jgi:acyl carrier protein
MIPTKEQIAEVIYASIDDLNEMLAPDQRLQKSMATAILKQGSGLDSLGFVNLVSLVEEKYVERFGESIVLTQTDPARNASHPYESIGALVDYIDSLARS